RAILADSSFRGASLAYANFSDALLMGANFRCFNQNKDCSDLWHTNFENANLTEAQFQQAVLESTNFRGANLTKANLNGAKMLTPEQLEDSILCQTTMPKYLDIPGDRNCPVN
ncbi:MAG TPA: pentapeptide repeat-containing protein, partial [Stenomitos sp.]